MRNSKFKIRNKMVKITLCGGMVTCLVYASYVSAQVASGGQFTLNQSVIANGGGTGSGGTITVSGTTGQSVAAAQSAAGPLALAHGFWNELSVPAAPVISIGGRIQTSDGTGVKNARLTLTPSNGIPAVVLSSSFGLFRFDNLAPGDTFTIRITSKRFRFPDAIRIVTPTQTITDMNFVAVE